MKLQILANCTYVQVGSICYWNEFLVVLIGLFVYCDRSVVGSFERCGSGAIARELVHLVPYRGSREGHNVLNPGMTLNA